MGLERMEESVKERPVLFKGEMVRAILADRKTCTRRLQGLELLNEKDAPDATFDDWKDSIDNWTVRDGDGHSGVGWYAWVTDEGDSGSFLLECPYGVPGDRLWVRETWRPRQEHNCGANLGQCDCDAEVIRIRYDADGAETEFPYPEDIPSDWEIPSAAARGNVPSIFLPRWASRITLEVIDVRVERLQQISPADAQAEGIDLTGQFGIDPNDFVCEFAELWDSINGKKTPWPVNPWVWRVAFRRIEQEAE